MLPGRDPCWVAAVAQVRWAHAVETLKAASHRAIVQVSGSLSHPHVLSLFAKVSEGSRSLFPRHNTTDRVSPPSPGLWDAELKMGSAAGIAFITQGGDWQPGQLQYILFLQKELSHNYNVPYPDLGRGNKCWRGHGRGLCCRQRCAAPTVWTGLLGACRSSGIYNAAGRTPLPAEQINYKALRRRKAKLLGQY